MGYRGLFMRETLKAAQGNLVAAEAALSAAVETADRARGLLEGIVREGEALDASALRASGAMAEAMYAAIVNGTEPPAAVSEREHSKAAAARAAIDLRRQAAEAIVADFASAQHEAERDVESARAAVAAAIQAIIRAEAESIIAEWARIDAEARNLRARLGGFYGPIHKLSGLGDIAYRAIELNGHDRVDLAENAAVADAWTAFATDLGKDPDARLDFAPVDHARDLQREQMDLRAQQRSAWNISPVVAEPISDAQWNLEMAMLAEAQ
jgi:hypothetical protein